MDYDYDQPTKLPPKEAASARIWPLIPLTLLLAAGLVLLGLKVLAG